MLNRGIKKLRDDSGNRLTQRNTSCSQMKENVTLIHCWHSFYWTVIINPLNPTFKGLISGNWKLLWRLNCWITDIKSCWPMWEIYFLFFFWTLSFQPNVMVFFIFMSRMSLSSVCFKVDEVVKYCYWAIEEENRFFSDLNVSLLYWICLAHIK